MYDFASLMMLSWTDPSFDLAHLADATACPHGYQRTSGSCTICPPCPVSASTMWFLKMPIGMSKRTIKGVWYALDLVVCCVPCKALA